MEQICKYGAEREIRPDKIRSLEDALHYAILIIENYEMDIRARPELVKNGFCQGRIYKDALMTIAKKREY